MKCAIVDGLPPDTFMLIGGERWSAAGVKERHVVAYKDGQIISRWMPVVVPPANIFEGKS